MRHNMLHTADMARTYAEPTAPTETLDLELRRSPRPADGRKKLQPYPPHEPNPNRRCARIPPDGRPGATTDFGRVVDRWIARRIEYERLGVAVDGERICDEVLRDLERLQTTNADETFNLTEAAELSGYSADHLGKLVREGTIPNAGRPGAPRIRRGDLPKRARALRKSLERGRLSPTEIARAVVTQQQGGAR